MGEIEKYLSLFDLDHNFNENDLKSAYRTLSKVWHPDRFESNRELRDKAEEKFKEINNGYQFLKEHLENKNTFESSQSNSYTANKNTKTSQAGQNHKKKKSSNKEQKKEYSYNKTNGSKSASIENNFNWKPILIFLGLGIFLLIINNLDNNSSYNTYSGTTNNQNYNNDQQSALYNNSRSNSKTSYDTEEELHQNDFNIEDNLYLSKELENKDSWADNEYYKYYLLSHETILDEIFYLDFSRSSDVEKYYEIAFNDNEYRLNKEFVDLNNNGHKDLMIENHSIGYIGSGGYSTYIFIYKSGRYEFLQEFFGDYIEVQETSSNGFKDLLFNNKKYLNGGGSEYVKDIMTWDGNEYTKENHN